MGLYASDGNAYLDDEGGWYKDHEERHRQDDSPCMCGGDHRAVLGPYAPGFYAYGWKPEGTVRHALVVLGPFETEDKAKSEAADQGLGPWEDFLVTVVYRPDPYAVPR